MTSAAQRYNINFTEKHAYYMHAACNMRKRTQHGSTTRLFLVVHTLPSCSHSHQAPSATAREAERQFIFVWCLSRRVTWPWGRCDVSSTAQIYSQTICILTYAYTGDGMNSSSASWFGLASLVHGLRWAVGSILLVLLHLLVHVHVHLLGGHRGLLCSRRLKRLTDS